ncbi:MAG: hypothetical protein ACTHJJ_04070 [Intrasporangium sp.]|uniref:hypothetical protein n=1 Tax=Intrasporangium sp. TaxID=1925024 RepID=UPI003F7DBFAC
MTWVAVVLIGLGVGDLARASHQRRAGRAAHLVTPAVILLVAVVTGLTSLPDWLALLWGAIGTTCWQALSRRTQATGRGALTALAALGVTLSVLLLGSGWASSPDGALAGWLAWADLPGPTPPPARLLLLLGLGLFNIATGNVIVRLVLLATGALRPEQVQASSTPQPSDRLKGGRLLGPMERLVILGLGLAGEFGAASLVIAAKGLLRFPEIQATARGNGSVGVGGPRVSIDEVTEYFLVGSFTSWLVALASLALAQ